MTTTGDNKSRLLTIPLEILQQIVSYLNTPEYGNIRLTCKHLEASLFNAFSREFFCKKQFMLTHFSLQALLDIANSRLAHGMQHVIMSVERPSRRAPTHNFLGGPFSSSSDLSDSQARRNNSREQYIDHLALLESGHDIEMMAQAFAKLTNLQTVEMRDFESTSRYRDNPRVEWRSYGKATYLTETGSSLEIPSTYSFSPISHDQNDYSDRLFQNMLRALGKTPVRPKRFEVNLRQGGITDKAFKLQKYDEINVVPLLENFDVFHFDLSSSFLYAFVAGQDQDQKTMQCSSYHLRQFLSRVDKVAYLRLNFQFFNSQEAQSFLSWLSKRPSSIPTTTAAPGQDLLPGSPPPVLFKNLRRLELGKVTIEPKTLLSVLQKHKASLREINFHRVGLLDSSEADGRVNQWSKFFGHMAKLGLSINHITAFMLSQEKERREHRRRVFFRDCPKGPRVWQGQDLTGALKDLMNTVNVDWPEEDTESSHTESDEDGDAFLSDLIDGVMEDLDEDDDSDDDTNDIVNASLLALSQQLPFFPTQGSS